MDIEIRFISPRDTLTFSAPGCPSLTLESDWSPAVLTQNRPSRSPTLPGPVPSGLRATPSNAYHRVNWKGERGLRIQPNAGDLL